MESSLEAEKPPRFGGGNTLKCELHTVAKHQIVYLQGIKWLKLS